MRMNDVEMINALLDLWDPYKIFLFPQDEYTSYAVEICGFIEGHKDLNIKMLTDFVFAILPPIKEDGVNNSISDTLKDSLAKVEYERFAKALLLVLEK